jgi:hypothetical protein
MRSSTLLASVVGIGRGRESTDGGRDERGELGRDDGRLVKRLLGPVDFFSLGNGLVRGGGGGSACLYVSNGD